MSIPVKRLKLLAFAFGAAIAGLTGAIAAPLRTGVFPTDFDLALLITVYCMVILGGTGSLVGVALGAIVVNVALEVLTNPEHARWLFYGVVLVGVLWFVRPWVWKAGVLAGTALLGLVLREVAERWWERGGRGRGDGGRRRRHAARRRLGAAAVEPDGDRELRVRRARRRRARAHAAPGTAPARRARAGALPRRLRLGEPARGRAEHHAADPDRGVARGADERPAAGAPRHRASGDRVTPLLQLRGVSMSFGGLTVISNLDLDVAEGEIVSVIGPNGAGKTTLFNLVTGVYQPDDGEILFEERSVVGLEPHQITRRGIARTFQTLRLFLNMSVKENVMAAAYGHTRTPFWGSILRTPGARREEREIHRLAEERLAFFGQRLMGYRWDQPAYSLSYANRRRLEIARATATRPRLLLLDEPAAGMNPVETHEITELIGELRDEGGFTILVIEHDMHVVEGISDRVVALDHGIKIAEGSFDAVATHPEVVAAYLGRREATTK